MSSVDLLLQHLDRLWAMHKAGETPQVGELLTMRDLQDDVRRDLQAERISVTAPPSTAPACSVRVVVEVLDADKRVMLRQPLPEGAVVR